MTEREHLYTCEDCGKPIHAGDQFQPADDCNFCPEHAATLADILDFWTDDIADQDNPCWPYEFDDIEDAQAHIDGLREQIAQHGPDHKSLRIA
ncbi:hypothetical protein [uncultured Paracoccus sp.]|uniref:hypothetical protein n=1 Tax=uncultured Paracoccus sp. TaxID=189685 RepID=UPI0025996844|nr:hypothetical protein [uncultured Paracoccus sp.]